MRDAQFRRVQTDNVVRSRSSLNRIVRKQKIRPEKALEDAEAQMEVDEYDRNESGVQFTSPVFHYTKFGNVNKQAVTKNNHEMASSEPKRLQTILERVASYAHELINTDQCDIDNTRQKSLILKEVVICR